MSGAVGSIPSLTRSGRPSPSLRSSSPAGSASTTFRSRYSASATRPLVIAAMLDSPPRRTAPRSLLAARPPWNVRGCRRADAHAGDHSEPDTAPAAGSAGRRGARRGDSQAQAEEAPSGDRPPGPLDPRGHVDHLRDDDGGLRRAALARERGPVQGGPELGGLLGSRQA